MGWKSALGAIGGGALGFFTGGPAGAVALGAKGFQAGNAMDAESSASKQSQAGYDKGAAVLSPYNARGNAAGDTLAGYLGINVPAGGFAGPSAMGAAGGPVMGPVDANGNPQGLGKLFAVNAAKDSNKSQTLSNFLNYSGLDEGDQRIQPMPMGRQLPSGSRGGSSYATREAV